LLFAPGGSGGALRPRRFLKFGCGACEAGSASLFSGASSEPGADIPVDSSRESGGHSGDFSASFDRWRTQAMIKGCRQAGAGQDGKAGEATMTKKSAVKVAVLDVRQIIVSGDGLNEAEIGLQLEGNTDLHLRLAPIVLAKLEAMLAKASVEQSKHQPVQ
jgi:hypothetical protein